MKFPPFKTMAEELIPNDTPEIAKLKACESAKDILFTYTEIKNDTGYKHFSDNYKSELEKLYNNLLNGLPF